MDFVKSQRCAVHGCTTVPVEAHHAGQRGLGKRAHDRTCIPLCRDHHEAWHGGRSPFSDPLARQSWTELQICLANEAYGRHRAAMAIF